MLIRLQNNSKTILDYFIVDVIQSIFSFEVTKVYVMTTIWFLGMDQGEVHEKRVTEDIFFLRNIWMSNKQCSNKHPLRNIHTFNPMTCLFCPYLGSSCFISSESPIYAYLISYFTMVKNDSCELTLFSSLKPEINF